MVAFLAKKGLSPILKNLFTGGKQKTTGTEVINSVKAKVNKTALDQAESNLAIAKHKYKGSNKKLETTVEKINEQTKRLNKNK